MSNWFGDIKKKSREKTQSQVYRKTKRETKPQLKSIYILSVELEFET